MPDKRYIEDPHLISLSGTERFPISDMISDYYSTPADLKGYVLSAYGGDTTITTVGTVGVGTWAGNFAPRISTAVTPSSLNINASNFDIYTITALANALAITLIISPFPNAGKKIEIRIKDNGVARGLSFNNLRANSLTLPTTTIAGRTMVIVAEYNLTDNIFDLHYCTDTLSAITPPILPVNQIAFGDGVNPYIGDSSFIWSNGGKYINLNSALFLGRLTSTIYGMQTSGVDLGLYAGGYNLAISLSGYAKTNVPLGINITPTAMLHMPAGTATAGTAPVKLTTGVALSATEDGALEYHGSHLFYTIGSTRYQLDQQGALLLAANNTWTGTQQWNGNSQFNAGLGIATTSLTITNVDVVLGTGAGTKFGTSTSQKLSLWGATPNIQPTTSITAASFLTGTSGIANDSATWGGYSIGKIVAALKQIGALA